MMSSDSPLPFIKDDGAPFDTDDLRRRADELSAMVPHDRLKARDENAHEIADHDAARMLAVSGPGTGKSSLFKARLRHWLDRYPDHRLVVATFVRKLVRDLNDDISNDPEISEEQKSRVSVLTLHSLGRSVIEHNHGTHDLPLRPRCLVVTAQWQARVWEDAVSLAGATTEAFPWRTIEEELFDGVPPDEGKWEELRRIHLQLQQFYNALTFPDLILLGSKAVTENPELVEQTLFIIDEFQDFNLAEKTFIDQLTAESDGVFLAGDDDQVLYDRLRRGHADIIRSYYRDTAWVNAMLPFCGRCDFHIVRSAEAFLSAEWPPDAIEKVFLPLGSEEGAAKVQIVAGTSPSSGVEYVKRFLDDHRSAIEQRQEELKSKSEKDSFLLVLTPAREMNFLKPGGARETLRSLVAPYLAEDEQLSDEYWRLRDYYDAAVDPSQNFSVRKVLAHESISRTTVAKLLREALDVGANLGDLDDDSVRACLERCEQVKDILQSGLEVKEKAQKLEAVGGFGSSNVLEHDLQLRPIGDVSDFEVESAAPEQTASTGAIEITTIVGAKGLSADHVIVLGCDDVNLAPVSRSAFFVALTRARKSLTLLGCMGGGGAKALHEFVCGLPEQHTCACQAKTGGTVRKFETIADLQAHLAKTEYAKQMAAQQRKKRAGI